MTKKRISVNLPDKMIVILKEFARRKDLNLSELLELWLDDRIRVEAEAFRKSMKKKNEETRKKLLGNGWSEWKKVDPGVMKKAKITFAEQKQVENLSVQCTKILAAIGIKSAWISDESTIGDFCVTPAKLLSASKKLGVKIDQKDLLWKIAEKL